MSVYSRRMYVVLMILREIKVCCLIFLFVNIMDYEVIIYEGYKLSYNIL